MLVVIGAKHGTGGIFLWMYPQKGEAGAVGHAGSIGGECAVCPTRVHPKPAQKPSQAYSHEYSIERVNSDWCKIHKWACSLMGTPATVALAAALIASGRELPERPTRYLVLWSRGVKRVRSIAGWSRLIVKGAPLAEVLRKYGVPVEEYRYTTTVSGRRYVRYKLVIRDERLTARLARLARDEVRLRRLLKRFESVVLDVLSHMARVRGWRRLLDILPWSRLRRWFGIKPFNYRLYDRWRNYAIARFLKPNWRAWLYRKLLAVYSSYT